MSESEFYISKEELEDALNFILPFVPAAGKDEDENETDALNYGKYYNYPLDAVCLEFHASYLLIYFQKGTFRIEVSICINYNNLEGISFAIPIHYTLSKIQKFSCENIVFKEQRFFGFNIFDADRRLYLFSVQAFSLNVDRFKKQFKIPSSFSKKIYLENQILRNTLSQFSKYCEKDYDGLSGHDRIWYSINNGKCDIIASNRQILKYRSYNTAIKSKYNFSIPAFYADRISSIIWDFPDMEPISISINDDICKINCNNDRYKRTIYCKQSYDYLPDINFLVNNKISHSFAVSSKKLQETFRRIEAIDGYEDNVVMHFMNDHINIYYNDGLWDISMYEFIDSYGKGDFIKGFNYKYLKVLLDEIYSDNLYLIFTRNDTLLFVLDDSEKIGGSSYRIIGFVSIGKELEETLEKGEKVLSKHKNYIKKYGSK